jgi:hypothetical protein
LSERSAPVILSERSESEDLCPVVDGSGSLGMPQPRPRSLDSPGMTTFSLTARLHDETQNGNGLIDRGG